MKNVAHAFRGLLERADLEGAVIAIERLDEAGKKEALAESLRCCEQWWKLTIEEDSSSSLTKLNYLWGGTEAQRTAAAVAALVLGDPAALVKRLDRDNSLVYGLEALPALQRLRPSWLAAGGLEALLASGRVHWELIAELRETGLCPRPHAERYAPYVMAAPAVWRKDRLSFVEWLDKHPVIKREDIPLIFQFEGGSRTSLAAVDKYIGKLDKWSSVLPVLVERGELDRDALLDVTLDALARDYPAFRAGWFSSFHEILKPTLDERAARQASYVRLLASTIAPTVSFALKALEVLHKKKRLDAPAFLDAVEPVMVAPQAGTVQRALAMLGALHKAGLAPAPRVAELALAALVHAQAAVQEAALALFEQAKGGELPELSERLRETVPSLAPSVQQTLGFAEPAMRTRIEEAPPPAAVVRNAFAAELVIEPPASVEAALDLLGRALEQPKDPELFERAIDGASRFCDASDELLARLGSPVLKRAQQLARRRIDEPLQAELVRVVRAWTRREIVPHALEGRVVSGVFRFVLLRADALLDRLQQRRARALMSAPSHAYGRLAAEVLEARLRAWSGPIDGPDAVLALLRLPEADATRLLPELLLRAPEHASALRLAASHLAADRLRARPYRETLHGYTFDTMYAQAEPEPDRSDPLALSEQFLRTHTLGKHDQNLHADDQLWTRWLAIALPRAPEWHAVVELQAFHGYFGNGSTVHGPLRCFGDPSVQPGPHAHLALAVALSSHLANVSLSARDVLIESEPGRVDVALLSAAFALLLPSRLIIAARWAKQLAEVAAVSPRHAELVRRAILGGLRGDPADAPRDVSKLLGLARELHLQLGARCDDELARAWLRALKVGGQSAQHAKALLAF